MVTTASLPFICLLTSLPAFYPMSLDTNVTAEAASTSLAASGGGLEMRKLRHIEAELEVLRRTVTEMKAGAQCESQSLLADSGSKPAAMLEDDASQLGRAVDPGNEGPGVAQNIQPPLYTGAVYERWGNERCPNDTELVYSGVVGGSSHAHTGAAARALCLPLNPVLENSPAGATLIYGGEFQVSPLPQQDLDPLCAVCRVPRATVIMVPAASTCHPGWTLEYSGHLMAGHHTHPAATAFLCVDKEKHTRIGSNKNEDGFLFYFVSAVCGSLPCAPYESGKVFPCVVCSK